MILAKDCKPGRRYAPEKSSLDAAHYTVPSKTRDEQISELEENGDRMSREESLLRSLRKGHVLMVMHVAHGDDDDRDESTHFCAIPPDYAFVDLDGLADESPEVIGPGVYPDLDNEKYHSGPGLSSTELKPILSTAKEFLHNRESRRPDTAALELGTVLHEAILTPDALEHEYRFYDRHKTRCKTYWKWAQENECIGLFPDDLELIQGVRESLQDHDIIKGGLLSGGRSEWSFYADIEGQPCKCRPDYHIEDEDGFIVVDLKSTRGGLGHPRRWNTEFCRRGYDFSAGMYCEVMEAATGKPVKAWIFLVVEKSPPYLTSIHHLSARDREIGTTLLYDALEKFKKLEAGELESLGYGNEIFTTQAPDWRAAEAGL